MLTPERFWELYMQAHIAAKVGVKWAQVKSPAKKAIVELCRLLNEEFGNINPGNGGPKDARTSPKV